MKLYKKLSGDERVEIVTLMDNRSMSISEKRNRVMLAARGKYFSFLDDDDDVSDDFIPRILETIEANPDTDVITFDQLCSLDGLPMKVSFGLGNPHDVCVPNHNNTGYWDIQRPPYHMCVWKMDIAATQDFRPIYNNNGQSCEDIDWLQRLYPLCKTTVHIDEILHHYIYSSKTTTSIVKEEIKA